MKIRVLYFAGVRDLLGHAEEPFDLPEGSTVSSVRTAIEARHVVLGGALDQVRFARNEAFARLEDEISEGDTLAVIPPVAGG